MPKKRLAHIDLLETIAMLWVVLYHGTLYPHRFLETNGIVDHLLYGFRGIMSTCVPLFFFVNGYLLFGRELNLKKHIRKMIRLVLITGIWGVVSLLLLQVIRGEYLTPMEMLKTLWSWKTGWINHLWYMGALICIYVVFPLLKQAFDTNKQFFRYFVIVCTLMTFGNVALNQAGAVAVNLLGGEPMTPPGMNFFNIFNPFRGIRGYAFVYFCLGGIAWECRERVEAIPAGKRNAVAIAGILLSCVGMWALGVHFSRVSGNPWDMVWKGYDMVFTLLNTVFLYLLSLNMKRECRLIKSISANTLGIYYIHVIIIDATRPILRGVEIFRNLPMNILYAFAVILVCLGISLILRKIPVVSKLV